MAVRGKCVALFGFQYAFFVWLFCGGWSLCGLVFGCAMGGHCMSEGYCGVGSVGVGLCVLLCGCVLGELCVSVSVRYGGVGSAEMNLGSIV